MAPRGRAIASRHLVCAICSSWVQFDSAGFTNSWAEMSRGACPSTYNGCWAVESLVGVVEDLSQTVESMKRKVTGQGLEEKGRNRGSSGNTGRSG